MLRGISALLRGVRQKDEYSERGMYSMYMSKSKITAGVVGIVLIILIIVYVVVSGRQGMMTKSEVHVGVILPLTGQYASLGESDRNAMLLAQKDLGPAGANIKLYFEDDAYDAKTAVSAYQKLKSLNHIDVVVVLSAPSIQSIAPLTNTDGIPLLGLGGTIVYEKDTVFQLMPSGNLIFSTLGKLYGEKYKKIAVAHSSAPLFVENARMFRTGLPAGVEAPDHIVNPAGDHRTEVQKIVASRPDAVTLFMPKDDAIKFLQALRVQDRNRVGHIAIVCDFGVEIAVAEYTEAIGKDRLEGCVSTNLADTAQEDFKNRYRAAYAGAEPQLTADYAYDAVGLIKELADAAEAGPEKAPAAGEWVKRLSSSDFIYKGKASGEIRFNEDGTRLDLPPVVKVYRNGVFVPM